MVGLAATLLTYTLSFAEAFASFSAEVPWLIAIAMFLAQAIRKTGLGKRLSYLFISFFGSSTLGMTYSLVFSEFLLSPMIPSVAARSGGIVLPLVRSMSEACGSQPNDGTARKLGAYLMATCFHTSAVSSAMFLTANHPNPLSAQLAAATIDKARSDLKALGKPQYGEGMTLFAMAVTIALWIGAEHFHYGVVTAALAGLSILLVSKVITWEECLGYQSAWNTMTWFAVLIAMATQLKKLGVIGVFSSEVATAVSTLGWGWQPSFVILVLVYFYSHYFFASNIAHVSAMYSAFLAVAIATGAPPMFAALVFAFFSNIQGTLTQYGMSHAPMYFGQDYVPLERWLLLGFLVSVVNITVWLTVGGFWWKFLGLW
ncbi:unnamed protein product [Ostreobium quekettii]|uniref:Uncharacterized protein n=1 Tax=Ostreobium quekettii TaxID=121088 RepID=A0A8S1IQ05_9CHLO|nr:unnamed protein product [Ostreobium quekettii]